MSERTFSEGSAFSTPDAEWLFHTHSQSPADPAPPGSPPTAPSPRRGPPTGNSTSMPDQRAASTATTAANLATTPDVCCRLSEHNVEVPMRIKPARSIPQKSVGFQRMMTGRSDERVHHLDVQETLVPLLPSQSPMLEQAETGGAATGVGEEYDEMREPHGVTQQGETTTVDMPAVTNPLRRESASELASTSESKSSSSSSDTDTQLEKGSMADDTLRRTSVDALLDNCGAASSLFSLSSIATPRTAEEYFEQVAKIDHVRCGLGQELEGDAKDVYGPTWPFSKLMIATKVFGYRKCDAPNCDHKTPIQAVTGPQIWSLLFIYGVLFIYPVFTTVAYSREKGWGGIIPIWGFSCVTGVFVTLCAFTNPGIVPRRQLKNVTDRGDILIVRVPAPNAQAVLDKLQVLPDIKTPRKNKEESESVSAQFTAEAIHEAVMDGNISPSVFNHKRTTVYSMERYFETDTGRIVPYNPVLSESDLAVPTLEFPITFCRTCRVARGPRTHHCKVCNNCVDGMDHHCRWTNCCIGRNNYPFFFMSLLSLHVMVGYSLLYNVVMNIVFINEHKSWTLWDLLRYAYGMPIFVYASFFFLGLFFFPLFLGHIYMTMMGLTTNEMLKKKWTESKYFGGVNPWSYKHWWLNVYSRLLKKSPRTQDDPMKWTDSRYYYGVTVAAAVEDQKVDWLIALPMEERKRVEARAAAERDEGAKARPAQEKAIIEKAMQKRGFRVSSD